MLIKGKELDGFHPEEDKFKVALAYLERDSFDDVPTNYIEIGYGVKLKKQSYTTHEENDVLYEAHDLYHDLIYIVEGAEANLLIDRQYVKVIGEYDANMDSYRFQDPTEKEPERIEVLQGEAVFIPTEKAHKPKLKVSSCAPLTRILIKIPR